MVAREGDPIIICDDTVPDSDLVGMFIRSRQQNSLFSYDSNIIYKRLCLGIKRLVKVPRTVDCVQGVLTVIPLQLLSYHIAELNGRNVRTFKFIV